MRVRSALHTAEAQLPTGNYFGDARTGAPGCGGEARSSGLTDELRERLCLAMGEDRLAAEIDAGGDLSTDDAVAWLRRARGTRKRPAGGWESLTPTERQVVALAAEGLTNPEIGERMFIARGTVKIHLSHIYAKLGVRNRSELVGVAARRVG